MKATFRFIFIFSATSNFFNKEQDSVDTGKNGQDKKMDKKNKNTQTNTHIHKIVKEMRKRMMVL